MEAVCSSKMLVSTFKSTWRYNPEIEAAAVKGNKLIEQYFPKCT
jgi:hypothetical protein